MMKGQFMIIICIYSCSSNGTSLQNLVARLAPWRFALESAWMYCRCLKCGSFGSFRYPVDRQAPAKHLQAIRSRPVPKRFVTKRFTRFHCQVLTGWSFTMPTDCMRA